MGVFATCASIILIITLAVTIYVVKTAPDDYELWGEGDHDFYEDEDDDDRI